MQRKQLPTFEEWKRVIQKQEEGSPVYRHQEGGQHPDESLLSQFGQYIEFAGNLWAKDAIDNMSNIEMVLNSMERMAKGLGQALKENGMKLVVLR